MWALLKAEEIPFPPRLSSEEAAQVALLAPRVLEHFGRHRPDPASFPALAMEIVRMSHAPDPDTNELMRHIALDPAISMHLLRVANSAHFRRDREILDLRRAVLQIGMREVGHVASAVAARSLFDAGLKAEFEAFAPRWKRMFLDTMAVAFGASALTFEQQMGRADHAFLSGMFHDIGKSIALRSLAALIHEGQVEAPSEAVVDAVLERVHVEVGGEVHLAWGLPEYLVQVCLRHHDFELPSGPEFSEIHILRLAEGFHRLAMDPGDARHLHETRQSLRAIGLSHRGALRLYQDAIAQVERAQVLLGA